MKKLLFLFMLCLCGAMAFADNDTKDGGSTSNLGPRYQIRIDDAMTPADPDQMRSLIWYAEAWLDYTMNCIEVETNQMIGKADVVITDLTTGRTVSSATINPNYTTVAWLPLPSDGTYRMTITAAEYLGEADFTVE